MSALRTALVVGVGAVLASCTFTRSLDYLTNGTPDVPDTGTSSSGSTSSTTSSTTTSSSGDGQAAGEVIASAQASPTLLRQDAANLYWITDDSKLRRVAKTGGTPQDLGTFADALDLAVEPAADGNLYVLTTTAVKAVTKAAGALPDFVALPVSMDGIGIVADGTSVFVLVANNETGDSQLLRYPKANPAAPVNLSPAGELDPVAITLAGGRVFWSATTSSAATFFVRELAVDAPAGTAPKDYKGGSTGISAAQGQLVADAEALYWIDDSEYFPYRFVLNGSAPQKLLNSSNDKLAGIAAGAGYIYLTEQDDRASRIVRIPKDGRDPDELAPQPNPGDVVADDNAVYVAFAGLGGVGATGGIQRIASK